MLKSRNIKGKSQNQLRAALSWTKKAEPSTGSYPDSAHGTKAHPGLINNHSIPWKPK